MRSIKLALLFGFLVGLIPFVVKFFLYPLLTYDPLFFESIMTVVITLVAVIFSLLYFRKVDSNFLKEGILLGIIFLAFCIAIDLIFFLKGPTAMPLINYFTDVGFTYLLIPVITIGFGYALSMKRQIRK